MRFGLNLFRVLIAVVVGMEIKNEDSKTKLTASKQQSEKVVTPTQKARVRANASPV